MLAQTTAPAMETAAELLTRVEQYYNHAMGNVFWALAVGLVFVGIVAPVLMYLLQSHSFDQREKRLRAELTRMTRDRVGKVMKRADLKLQKVATVALVRRNHHSAWIWHELARDAFTTSKWNRGLIYWCRSINGALEARWPDKAPDWDRWIECFLAAKHSSDMRVAVRDNADVKEAVLDTMGYLQRKPKPREYPYSRLLGILNGLLLNKAIPGAS